MVYTSADIINSVKRNQSIANTTFRFTDVDLLAMADEEIESTIVPTILELHADRLLYKNTIALVSNQSNYDLPYRAIGTQLKDVILQDSLTPTWKRDLKYYEAQYGDLNTQTGTPSGFYFFGDQIYLVPGVSSSTTLYLSYSFPIQHPKLVDSTSVSIISSVNYTTGVITLAANAPLSWATTNYFDFLITNDRSKPRIASYDKNASSIVTNTITFAVTDIPTGLVAGDRVALAQQTDVLLLPNECYKYLTKAVELKILEAQKDIQAIANAKDTLIKAKIAMESVLTPRITGEARVVLNRSGLIRRGLKKNFGTATVLE